METWKQLVKDALDQITNLGGAQIVVFPEDAILHGANYTTRESKFPYLEQIPEISKLNTSVNPCTQSEFANRPILRNLSCFARQYKCFSSKHGRCPDMWRWSTMP